MEQSWWNQKCGTQWNAFTCRLRLWIQKMTLRLAEIISLEEMLRLKGNLCRRKYCTMSKIKATTFQSSMPKLQCARLQTINLRGLKILKEPASLEKIFGSVFICSLLWFWFWSTEMLSAYIYWSMFILI
jgi:hypothetical protein